MFQKPLTSTIGFKLAFLPLFALPLSAGLMLPPAEWGGRVEVDPGAIAARPRELSRAPHPRPAACGSGAGVATHRRSSCIRSSARL